LIIDFHKNTPVLPISLIHLSAQTRVCLAFILFFLMIFDMHARLLLVIRILKSRFQAGSEVFDTLWTKSASGCGFATSFTKGDIGIASEDYFAFTDPLEDGIGVHAGSGTDVFHTG
jgi:hypothetical protein